MHNLQMYGTNYGKQPMETYINKHDIILHFHLGFQSGLACESQLTETVHDWNCRHWTTTRILMQSSYMLPKAFDKVPHKRLLSKLTSYGITGNTHTKYYYYYYYNNWITYVLYNRKQRVSVNGTLSDITYVTYGVHMAQFWGLYSSCCTSTT